MIFRNVILLTFIFGALVSCQNDVKDVNGSESKSNFNYDRISVVDIQTYSTDSQWPDLKDKVLINLSTCLLDSVYLDKIAGESFEVDSESSSYNVDSNSAGCISWSEELDFNYLNQEAFYEIKGKISGKGSHKGFRAYRLAVNPWQKKVVDLRQSSVFNLIALEKNLKNNKNIFNTESFSFSVLDRTYAKNKTSLTLDISTTPELLRKNILGGVVKEKLTAGEFDVSFYLLSKKAGSDERTIISEYHQDEVSTNNEGLLNIEARFDILGGLAQMRKEIPQLGVRLTPVHDSLRKPIEGVISFTDLSKSFTAKLVRLKPKFNILTRFSKSNKSNSESEIEEESDDDFGFVIDSVQIRNGAESGENNSQSHRRTVDAVFSLDIIDSLDKKSALDQKFKVIIKSEETGKIIFNDELQTLAGSGKLNFRSQIPFNTYGERGWNRYTLVLEGKSAPYKNLGKKRLLYINPWIKTSDFGIDSKFGKPAVSTADNTPEIYLEKFTYGFVGNSDHSFKLNKFLDLAYTRTMRIEAYPKTKTSHSFNGPEGNYKPLLNGEYRLRALILVPKNTFGVDYTKEINLDDFYTLTGDSKKVMVENGYLNTKINLPLLFNDLMFLSLKNPILLELSPVDETISLKSGYFVGTIVATKNKGIVIRSNPKGITSGNLDIAKTLISRLGEVQNKLVLDKDLPNTMDMFLDKISKSKTEKVPTLNFEKYKIEQKNTSIEIFDTPKSFLRKYGYGWRSPKDVEAGINNANPNQLLKRYICHALYNKNAKTDPSRKDNEYEFGYWGGPDTPKAAKSLRMIGLWFSKCESDFEKFVELKKFNHVKKIIEQPSNIRVESHVLTRANAFFVSAGQQFAKLSGTRVIDYTAKGIHGVVGADLPLPGDFFSAEIAKDHSIGQRADLYSSDNLAQIVSNQERVVNDDSMRFSSINFSMDFTAEVRTCVLFLPKNIEMRPLGKNKSSFNTVTRLVKAPDIGKHNFKPVFVTSPKRIYLCSKGSRRLQKTDGWHFVKLTAESKLADTDLAQNSIVNFIRGDVNYNTFRKKHIETDRALVIKKSYDKDVAKRTAKYLENHGRILRKEKRMGAGYPGLLE